MVPLVQSAVGLPVTKQPPAGVPTRGDGSARGDRASEAGHEREVDDALVVAVLGGDSRSFQQLVERHQERIFALVRHYASPAEVEDIVQETFLKAFRRLDTFQRQSSFSTWIYRIAVNSALDFLKRRGRSPVHTVEDPEIDAGPAPRVLAPDARLQREEIAAVTHKVLAAMPEIFRTVLVMREFEGRTYQDMADVLGLSIGTVESRLFRARARFRDLLIQRHPEFAAIDG
ncbi:MAG: sigma-70 family RNA polymerase sigma factor [Planctomycetota bacterium]|nr:MAG: sigma-70 family RNA polymerase sigma factor [Planctomycetota bacterium]